MSRNAKPVAEKAQISVTLHGEDLKEFRAYKRRQNLMHDAEAARKLMLERLQQQKAA